MEQAGNARDASDEGDDRSVKKPRTDNVNNLNSPFTFVPPATTLSPRPFDAVTFSPTLTQPSTPFAETAGNFVFGDTTATNTPLFGVGSNQSIAFGQLTLENQPLVFVNNGSLPSGTSQAMDGSRSTPGSSRLVFGPGGDAVPSGLVQNNTQPGTPLPSIKSKADTIKREEGSTTPTVKTQPVTRPDPAPLKVEILDPRGDLILVAGQEKVAFRVCSRSLARSFPVWEAAVPCPRQTSQPGPDDWVIHLGDDNPESLRIVLQIIHGKVAAIPALQDLAALFRLVIVCDKYGMVDSGLLKDSWPRCLQNLPPLSAFSLDPEPLIQRLWIAQKLNHQASYREVLEKLLLNSCRKKDRAELFLGGFPQHDLHQNTHLQSLGVLG